MMPTGVIMLVIIAHSLKLVTELIKLVNVITSVLKTGI